MGLFRAKTYTRIDRSTGRNKRDKCTQRDTHGGPARRRDGSGKIARKARLQHQRDRKTGKK